MSLIEKAVQRLEELRQAGVDVGDAPAQAAAADAQAMINTPAPQVAAVENAVASATVTPTPAAAPRVNVNQPSVEIDLARLDALGMVTSLRPRTVIAEEYRVIKRPLLRNATGRGAAPVKQGNLIMVSSSMPGEGKSFSSINLAMSIAMEVDHRVLLVDADVSRPSVLNILGLPPTKGLMDVLLNDDLDLSDVMLKTNIENLTLLPAGMANQRATELLASDAMNRLLNEMAARYPDRIIIFDSPPLLVTTEARVLATHMGQVVLVVEAGRATHSMVKQSLSTIESCPVKLMLLNKTRQPSTGAYGYYTPYGYGYGYGSGGEER